MSDRPARKPVIGLVGGIGAGKSAAAAAMARRGGRVVDGDRLGHEALELPDVKRQLVERWGERVLKPNGAANRRAIAGDRLRRTGRVEGAGGDGLPAHRPAGADEIAEAQADPAVRFVVLDAAVMLEAGWADACDRLVYVDASRDVRLARLAARSGWKPAEVAAREAAQLAPEAKRARADAVLDERRHAGRTAGTGRSVVGGVGICSRSRVQGSLPRVSHGRHQVRIEAVPHARRPPPRPDPSPAPPTRVRRGGHLRRRHHRRAGQGGPGRAARRRWRPRRQKRKAPAAGRIDPNESGFDAETNSRYEEIKRGSTFITQLQQMTLAQLQKAAKDDNIPARSGRA